MLTQVTRPAALALVGVLALTGCGGGSDEEPSADASSDASSGAPSPRSTSDPSATPTTDVKIPSGLTLTEPGARLSFGQTAKVAYEVKRPSTGGGRKGGKRETAGTVLALTVDSATKGSLADLAGFNITDPYQRRANYYYVQVAVRNIGKQRFGDADVPLWGISGENTLLPPVRFTSAFAKCPTSRLPTGFAPGERIRTCLVFLSPDKGSLEGVSYRPTEESTPIEWRGKVVVPRQGRDDRRGSRDGG